MIFRIFGINRNLRGSNQHNAGANSMNGVYLSIKDNQSSQMGASPSSIRGNKNNQEEKRGVIMPHIASISAVNDIQN